MTVLLHRQQYTQEKNDWGELSNFGSNAGRRDIIVTRLHADNDHGDRASHL